MCGYRKNLTHLQSVLLFKDSSEKKVVIANSLWQCLRLSKTGTLSMAYAIFRSGGKQYRVSPGEIIAVEKLAAASGNKVTFSDVVFLADGDTITTGNPIIAGANVTGEVIEQFKDKKVVAYKYKRRKGYHRTVGHRRQLTRVKIRSIV
jgi:large subunit ribosomal protein L21